MNNTRAEFQKRIEEIDLYFQLLNILDKRECYINCRSINNVPISEPINEDLVKILKANGFLLLYNIIEATITKSLEAIFITIQHEQLTFQQLSDNIRNLWINQKVSPLKAGIDAVTFDKIRNIIADVANNIIEDKILLLELSCLQISGNIDAQKIRDIAEKIGFKQTNDGRDLVTIKNKRNHLAHGEFTFGEIGKEYTVNEMVAFKENTVQHLSEVLINIETFISQREFTRVN